MKAFIKQFFIEWSRFIDCLVAAMRGDKPDVYDTAHALDELGKQAKTAAHWISPCGGLMKLSILLMLVLIIPVSVHAQKATKRKPSVKNQDTNAPVRILTAGFGRNERGNSTCGVMLTNNDPKRTIKSIQWTATTIELLTQKPIDNFELEANTLFPIEPKKGGMIAAVLDSYTPQTNCTQYEAQEQKTNDGIVSYRFMPNRCTRRWLFIWVNEITFTDGSKWPAAK